MHPEAAAQIEQSSLNNVYVHVPFCRSKCPFCYIPVQRAGTHDLESYLQAVGEEIEGRVRTALSRQSAVAVRQIYFGGGTPSLAPPESLGWVLAALRRVLGPFANTTVTLEILPEQFAPDYFERLDTAGFNRVAVGVQTFDAPQLAQLKRPYSARVALACLDQARRANIASVACELMWGYPEAEEQSMSRDFQEAADVGATEVSFQWYNVRDGSNAPSGAGLDRLENMFARTRELAIALGYQQCSAQTFRLPGEQASAGGLNAAGISATSYGAILGVGWQAVSYLGLTSGQHVGTLQEYLRAPAEHYHEELIADEHFFETALFYELTMSMHFDVRAFVTRFCLADLSEAAGILPTIIAFQEAGVISSCKEGGFDLTPRGQAILDAAMASMGTYNRGGAVL